MEVMGVFVRGGPEDGLRVRFSGSRWCVCTGTAAGRCRSDGGLKRQRCADCREQRGSPRRIVGCRVLRDDHKRRVRHPGGRRRRYLWAIVGNRRDHGLRRRCGRRGREEGDGVG